MATTPIDLNSAQHNYRRTVGDQSAPTTYGMELSVGGQDYTFVPNSIISKGLSYGGNQYVLPWFLNRDNLAKVGEIGIPVDTADFPQYQRNGVPVSEFLKNEANASTQGVLIPTGSLGFDGEVRTFESARGSVVGMGERNGQLVYLQDKGGASDKYMTSNGDIQTITTSGGGGGLFGGFFDDIIGGVSDFFSGIDDAVNELPGGWGTVALVAGGAALANAAQTASVSLSGAGAGAGAAAAGGASALSPYAAQAAGAYGGSAAAAAAAATGNLAAIQAASAAQQTVNLGTGMLSGAPPPTAPPAGSGSPMSGVTPPVVPPVGAPPVAGAAAGAGAGTGVTSSMLSAISSATGIEVDTLKTFAPSVIQGLLSAGGSYLQSEQAKDAAETQANAQIRAAQIAADAAKFRPVGVTTRFGSSNFTTDAAGNVTGAGYTPSAEITGYQDRLRTLAGQGMTDIEGARAAYQPLTGAAQSLFGLGQGYLSGDLGQPITSMGQRYMQSQAGQPLTQLGQQYIASDVGQPLTSLGQQYLQKSPDQIAADYITKQQALLAPTQENQLAQLQNKLFQQGRGGAATAQGGNLMATSPELAAYYNSLAQQDLVLAAQADQEARNRITYGAGLFDTGANLQGRFYTGQTGAYAPFATAMDTSATLERLAERPLTLGTEIGARTTAGTAAGGRFLSEGITSAAQTMAPANAYSGTGNLLRGVGESTNVAGLLNNAFGVQPQQTSLDAEKLRLFNRLFGT